MIAETKWFSDNLKKNLSWFVSTMASVVETRMANISSVFLTCLLMPITDLKSMVSFFLSNFNCFKLRQHVSMPYWITGRTNTLNKKALVFGFKLFVRRQTPPAADLAFFILVLIWAEFESSDEICVPKYLVSFSTSKISPSIRIDGECGSFVMTTDFFWLNLMSNFLPSLDTRSVSNWAFSDLSVIYEMSSSHVYLFINLSYILIFDYKYNQHYSLVEIFLKKSTIYDYFTSVRMTKIELGSCTK